MGDMEVLCQLLWNPANETAWSRIRRFGPAQAARVFVKSAFVGSVCEALIERHYVLHHRKEKVRNLDEAFSRELAPAAFLQGILSTSVPEDLEFLEINAGKITSLMVLMATHESPEYLRTFAETAVREMMAICQPPYGLLQNSLYRTFDVLDELFGLDYGDDRAMDFTAREGERIFAGAGRGVQSSYLSLFTALRNFPDAPLTMIDLGSGYGRVGLIAGLLNRRWSFIGYEFVLHRVTQAKMAAGRLGLDSQVRFFSQDLSDPSFRLPAADIYYLYDPFNVRTYGEMLRQIEATRAGKTVSILAKGGALAFIQQAGMSWGEAQLLDEGHLGLFTAR